ncbi:hypothetical protein L1887_02817 [Cichorium endivia]|nr:hypothetical protein L1887_02817 [Cichorium endivia]
MENQKTRSEIEEPTLKIGGYSVEERKDKILKYLKKRNQRNFNKMIKVEMQDLWLKWTKLPLVWPVIICQKGNTL